MRVLPLARAAGALGERAEVAVSYEAKTAHVVFDDAVTTAEALSQATAAVGFPATLRAGGS